MSRRNTKEGENSSFNIVVCSIFFFFKNSIVPEKMWKIGKYLYLKGKFVRFCNSQCESYDFFFLFFVSFSKYNY